MIDLLYYVTAAIIGGVAGYFIGKEIAKYYEKAKSWFTQVWNGINRVKRAIGLLIRQGNRLFKRLVALQTDGEVEEYYDKSDDGVEYKLSDLSDEARKALEEDDYIPVACYE